ncbi:NUDIX domain-containing protein [Armatimonas sp.]|uniref:NUDIX hydrolase n=1 Tax=Armatimonas sp. TaxID=1872638 RepID=UPI003752801B
MSAFFPAHLTVHFCPHCGVPSTASSENFFACAACSYRLHFNNTVAVAVLAVNSKGELLFIRRARDPGKGKLALPGGFVDPGETAEDATRREVMEELGVAVTALSFLCTAPNIYPYRGIVYTVCDLFFVAELAEQSFTLAPREVESTIWLAPQAVDLDEIAFPSMRAALALYRENL